MRNCRSKKGPVAQLGRELGAGNKGAPRATGSYSLQFCRDEI